MKAIDQELSTLHWPAINTLFIGGGTPTHLRAGQLARLLACLQHRFQLSEDAEFTVEANPEDIDETVLSLLGDQGVNRISLGVQSFSDRKLRRLERSHSGQQARDVIELAAKRIPNVSIDLIFAAPGESVADWQRDLSIAFSLPITHLSTYALTFEKGTSFWSRRRHGDLQSIDEQSEVEMFQHTREACPAAGLEHYEISNFAKPGFRCRHNLAYWQGQSWYGVGPGAARFVHGRRDVNHRSTTTYLHRVEQGVSPIAESETISVTEHARERAAFGVRMIDGVDLDQVLRETGVNIQQLCGPAIAECQQSGFVTCQGGLLRLTDHGVLFADVVASALLG